MATFRPRMAVDGREGRRESFLSQPRCGGRSGPRFRSHGAAGCTSSSTSSWKGGSSSSSNGHGGSSGIQAFSVVGPGAPPRHHRRGGAPGHAQPPSSLSLPSRAAAEPECPSAAADVGERACRQGSAAGRGRKPPRARGARGLLILNCGCWPARARLLQRQRLTTRRSTAAAPPTTRPPTRAEVHRAGAQPRPVHLWRGCARRDAARESGTVFIDGSCRRRRLPARRAARRRARRRLNGANLLGLAKPERAGCSRARRGRSR